ncbi:non-ribosomal peptide synthetase [Nocardia nova SH22a]|uniref:Non-ribosomal peptide synthetase n=1 Tax=Nocardia nova SH22a TaxID=1415166 RepID=W5TGB9_9NOCA|nr:non-ribosomal peptide synthetase [Nocardia nova]AHH18365.1 non-ribosomal peptide synthetase [Nocardia nova SH22a]
MTSLHDRRMAMLHRRLVDSGLREHDARNPLEVTRTDGDSGPLAPLQHGIWYHQQFDPEDWNYNHAFLLVPRRPLDRIALSRAIDAAVRIHEVFVTRYPVDADGNAVQQIDRTLTARHDDIDIPAGFDAEQWAERTAHRRLTEPFDLARDHPLRITYLHHEQSERHAAEVAAVVMVLHHISADGMSVGALFETVAAGLASAAETDLGHQQVRYLDFARWQQGYLGKSGDPTPTARRQLAFWEQLLSPLAVQPAIPALPRGRHEPRSATDEQGCHIRYRLPESITEELAGYARQAGVTQNMLFTAAVGHAIAVATGAGTFALGTVIDLRGRPELRDVVGFFANTVAIVVDTTGNPTFADYAARIAVATAESLSHRDIPFDAVVRAANPTRAPGARNQLIRTVVSAASRIPEIELAGIPTVIREPSPVQAKFDLAFLLHDYRDSGPQAVSVTYDRTLIDTATARCLLDSAVAVLIQGLRRPDTRLADLRTYLSSVPEAAGSTVVRLLAAGSDVCDHHVIRLDTPADPDSVVQAALSALERFDVLRIAYAGGQLRIRTVPEAVAQTTASQAPEGVFRVSPHPAGVQVTVVRGLLDLPSRVALLNCLRTRLTDRDAVLPVRPSSFFDYARSTRTLAEEPRVLDDAGSWLDLYDSVDAANDRAAIGGRRHRTKVRHPLRAHTSLFTDHTARSLSAVYVAAAACELARSGRRGTALIEVEHSHRGGAALADRPYGPIRCRYPVAVDLSAATDGAAVIAELLRDNGSSAPVWPVCALSPDAEGVFDEVPEPDLRIRIDHIAGSGPAAEDCLEREELLGDLDVVIIVDSTAVVVADSSVLDAGQLRGIAESLDELLERAREDGLLARPADVEDLLALTDAEQRTLAEHHPDPADVLPLTPLQEGLLFHLLADTGTGRARTSTYTTQNILTLAGAVDIERMAAAVAELVAAAPNLAARLVSTGGRYVQVVPHDPRIEFRFADLTHAGRAHPSAEAVMVADQADGFDDRAALARVTVIRSAPDRHHLMLTAEHTVLDGWSIRLVLLGILRRYRGDHTAEIVASTGLRRYLEWLAGQDHRAALHGWLDLLRGIEGPTLLTESLASSEFIAAGESGEHTATLDAEDTTALAALAQSAGVSPATVLELAWALTLGALVNSRDVLFGTVVSGRPDELEGSDTVVGVLFNTVPHRVRVDPRATVLEQLTAMRATAVTRMRYPYVGLSEIHRATGERALFDTLFVVQNLPERPDAAGYQRPGDPPLTVTGDEIRDSTHYPVSVAVMPREHVLDVRLIHRDVSAELAQTCLAQFTHVCRALTADCDRPVHRIGSTGPIFGADTGDCPVIPAAADDPGLCEVTSLLAATVERLPDEVALVVSGQSWTFREIWSQTCRFALLLRDVGIGPEDHVALALPRDHRMVSAIFGCLLAGAAYVPIDPDYPAERVTVMLDDARPRALIVSGGTRHVIGDPATLADGCLLLDLDDPAPGIGTESAEIPAPTRDLALNRLAYLMYTSGSTGKPKGVAVQVAGLSNMYANHAETVFTHFPPPERGGRRARISLTTTFSFDACWEQLLWLVAGHEVHIIDTDLRADAGALLDYYDTAGIDGFDSTPTFGEALIESGLLTRARPRGDEGIGVSFISLGGEAVNQGLWDRVRSAPGLHAYNFYGPTECTINALGAYFADHETPVIGRPLRGTAAFVLDRNLKPTPPGVVGELYLTGHGLSRGYHGMSALTAQRYIACPFGGEGTRMYRTGDLVRRRGDGIVEFVGRADEQVKVRGFRIELGDVVAALRRCEGVARAEVFADTVPAGGTALVGYLVATTPADPPDIGEIRTAMQRLVPEHMIPGYLVWVGDIPSTLSGKVDRTRLPDIGALLGSRTGRAPEDDRSQRVCAAYAEVLGVDTVYLDDDFFELGGHSLLVVELVAKLEAAGLTTTVRTVYNSGTPARLLDGSAADYSLAPVAELRPGVRTTVCCLPPAGGIGWSYYGALPFIASDVGVVVAQDPGLAAGGERLSALDELVEHYTRVVLGISPQPCVLLGWSFGGQLAHLVSQRLEHRHGLRTDVILLDSGGPLGGPPDRHLQVVADEAEVIAEAERFVASLVTNGLLDKRDRAATDAVFETYLRNSRTMDAAETADSLPAPTGRALLVSATADKPGHVVLDRNRQWDKALGELEIIEADLGHLEICTARGWQLIGERIGAFIEAARDAGAGA